MGIIQLYNDNLRKLPNEYGDVSVMEAVGSRREGSDKELKRTLQKLAPSWTVLG